MKKSKGPTPPPPRESRDLYSTTRECLTDTVVRSKEILALCAERCNGGMCRCPRKCLRPLVVSLWSGIARSQWLEVLVPVYLFKST